METTTDELEHTSEIDLDGLSDLKDRRELVILAGGLLGKQFLIDAPESGIGREVDNAVILNHSTVSRHHAQIRRVGDDYSIEDLGSRNGTFVNGERIEESRNLEIGDTIKVGGAILKFVQGGDTEARYHEEIYKRTILDELTGMANRRHLNDFLEREIARARRHHRPLSMVLIDLDHFKRVNDEFGHEAGDGVLRDVADTIARNVRRDELAARWGGEEFVVVLPETDSEGALKFAERVCDDIRDRKFPVESDSVSLTMSAGISEYERGMKAEDLIRKADVRLYQAKEQGRDQVVWSD